MRTTTKPKRPFNPDSRAHYDPRVSGYGNPTEWKETFYARLGIEEATRVVGDGSPWDILKVALTATWDNIKKAYRKLAMATHPDRGGDAAAFRKVQAAYEVLEAKFKRGEIKP